MGHQFDLGADPAGEKSCMYYKVQSGDSMATIGSVFNIPQLEIEVCYIGKQSKDRGGRGAHVALLLSVLLHTTNAARVEAPPGLLAHAECQPWRGARCSGGWLLCEAASLGQRLPCAWRQHQLPCVSGKRVPLGSKYIYVKDLFFVLAARGSLWPMFPTGPHYCRYVAESGDSLSVIATAFVVNLVELQVRHAAAQQGNTQAEEAW